MAVRAEHEAADEKPKCKLHYKGNSDCTKWHHAQKCQKLAATGQSSLVQCLQRRRNPHFASLKKVKAAKYYWDQHQLRLGWRRWWPNWSIFEGVVSWSKWSECSWTWKGGSKKRLIELKHICLPATPKPESLHTIESEDSVEAAENKLRNCFNNFKKRSTPPGGQSWNSHWSDFEWTVLQRLSITASCISQTYHQS